MIPIVWVTSGTMNDAIRHERDFEYIEIKTDEGNDVAD